MNLNFKFQLDIMLMDGSLVVNIAMADGLGQMDHPWSIKTFLEVTDLLPWLKKLLTTPSS